MRSSMRRLPRVVLLLLLLLQQLIYGSSIIGIATVAGASRGASPGRLQTLVRC